MTSKKQAPKKLWGLERGAMPYYARQLSDQDTIDAEFIRANPKAAKFYSDFSCEYYGNQFDNRRGLHDKAGIDRKELYTATNARQRDVYNRFGRRHYYEDHFKEDGEDLVLSDKAYETIGFESPEDSIIELLDTQMGTME